MESSKGKSYPFPWYLLASELIVRNVVGYRCLNGAFSWFSTACFRHFYGERNGRSTGGNIHIGTFSIIFKQRTLVIKNSYGNARRRRCGSLVLKVIAASPPKVTLALALPPSATFGQPVRVKEKFLAAP